MLLNQLVFQRKKECIGVFPILRYTLDEDYFLHFVLFARGIYLLSKEVISENDLNIGETCLTKFVVMFETLYSHRFYTLNLHNLIHLGDMVRNTGPLFVNNCFVFEDLNEYIVKHIHGTQSIDAQIIKYS